MSEPSYLVGRRDAARPAWLQRKDDRPDVPARRASEGPHWRAGDDRAGEPPGPHPASVRKLTFDEYMTGVYLPDAVIRLDQLTRADYRPIMQRDVVPLIGHLTLEELEEKPGLITVFKTQLAEHKRFPEGPSPSR